MKCFVLILLCLAVLVNGFSPATWISKFLNIWEDDRIIEIDTSFDWWENGVFYQIYPRSFKDSTGDGIGDLNGISSKLDYLKELGVTGIILGPVFASPMVDLGYDVVDFMQLDSIFGTHTDLLNLIANAKVHGLKIILDFVPNHTSDQHTWFQQSQTHLQTPNEYGNYYVWRSCNLFANDTRLPVNNWISEYNTPMWTYNPIRGQCYLHQFSSSQPDLNYRDSFSNITRDMLEILTHWLDVGVDGFRMHAVNQLFESASFTQEMPIDGDGDMTRYDNFRNVFSRDLEDSYVFMNEARRHVDEYSRQHGNITRILMTETFGSVESTAKWYGEDWHNLGSHLPNNFAFVSDITSESKNASVYKDIVDSWMLHMPSHAMGQGSWFLGNHDHSRIASRFGNGRHESMAIISMMLPGVAMIYYGDEIGMTDNDDISWEETLDVKARNTNDSVFREFTRDPMRTPMQWDSSSFGGFCDTCTHTWLPVNHNYQDVNVKEQQENPNGLLQLYKNLIKLRNENIVLQKGGIDTEVLGNNDDVFAFKRTLKDYPTVAVLINLGQSQSVSLLDLLHPDDVTGRTYARIIMSSDDTEIGMVFNDLDDIQLGEFNAVVFEVSSAMTVVKETTFLVIAFWVLIQLTSWIIA